MRSCHQILFLPPCLSFSLTAEIPDTYSSRFVDVSVHGVRAPGQGGTAQGPGRGAARGVMAERDIEEE